MCQVSPADPTENRGDRLVMLTLMLVERAGTILDAIAAVDEQAKGMRNLNHHYMDARPLLGAILVLANRQRLTDEQLLEILRIHSEIAFSGIQARDELRDLARRGAQGEDTQQRDAGAWILRCLDEPIPAEATHNDLVLLGAHDFLNAALQRPLGGS
jgi:hypothetical protein